MATEAELRAPAVAEAVPPEEEDKDAKIRWASRPDPAPDQTGGTGKKAGKGRKARPEFCHTINGSALALGRTLIALLENHQHADAATGRTVVTLPPVLAPYLGGTAGLRLEAAPQQ